MTHPQRWPRLRHARPSQAQRTPRPCSLQAAGSLSAPPGPRMGADPRERACVARPGLPAPPGRAAGLARLYKPAPGIRRRRRERQVRRRLGAAARARQTRRGAAGAPPRTARGAGCGAVRLAGGAPPPPPPLPYKVDTSRPSLRTNWTRLVRLAGGGRGDRGRRRPGAAGLPRLAGACRRRRRRRRSGRKRAAGGSACARV